MFLLVLLIAILSVPVLYIKNTNPEFDFIFKVTAFFAISTVIFFICHWVTYKKIHGSGFKNFISYVGMFIAFFSIAMGFSVHNSLAVLEGHFGKKSEFIRTPKFNVNKLSDSWKSNIYLKKTISLNTILESVLFLYFGFAIVSAFYMRDFGLITFHIMLFFGFGFVAFKSIFSRI